MWEENNTSLLWVEPNNEQEPQGTKSQKYGMSVIKTKLRGISPQANYTDWATKACRRS
jgi:hypothetical protein